MLSSENNVNENGKICCFCNFFAYWQTAQIHPKQNTHKNIQIAINSCHIITAIYANKHGKCKQSK